MPHGKRVWVPIVLLLVACAAPASAQGASGARAVQFAVHGYVESWDFNGRPGITPRGGTIGLILPLHDRWVQSIELTGTRAVQRPPSAFIGGLAWLARREMLRRGRLTLFLEGGAGASYATHVVPPNGTSFNYLLQAGGGFSTRVTRRVGLTLSLRLFHVSNNGLNGSTHNPDIEALGGQLGMFVRF